MTKKDQPPVLQKVPDPRNLLESARANNKGSRPWVQWKDDQAIAVVELAEKAERMELLDLNLEGDMNVLYGVQMPVPRWPVDDRLVIDDRAVFHLAYHEDWVVTPPAGWEPLGLFQPHDIFHPNMRPSLRGAICLGQMPPGVPATEIIFLGYYALALQDYELNELDPNGVLNAHACEFLRRHPEYLPLTTAGFLDPLEPPEINDKEPK